MSAIRQPKMQPELKLKFKRTFDVIRRSAELQTESEALVDGDGVADDVDIDEDDDGVDFESDDDVSDDTLAYLENEGNKYIRKCELVLQKSREVDAKIKMFRAKLDWLEARSKEEKTESAAPSMRIGASSRLENKIEHAKRTVSSLRKENRLTCAEIDKLRLARLTGVRNGAVSQVRHECP